MELLTWFAPFMQRMQEATTKPKPATFHQIGRTRNGQYYRRQLSLYIFFTRIVISLNRIIT